MQTERTIRFALWNNEETGLNGARAYIAQRGALQGKEDPAGSGKYPEPKWLGMIQHDMMMFDHGMPRADGTVSKEQRPEADVNIEFQVNSKMAAESAEARVAVFRSANEKYATDYPGHRRQPHDEHRLRRRFRISSRRSAFARTSAASQIGAAGIRSGTSRRMCSPPISDKDFRLGLNAAQTTLGGVATLTGATLKKVNDGGLRCVLTCFRELP